MICVLQLPFIVQHLSTELGKVVLGLFRLSKLYIYVTTKYSDNKQHTQSKGNTHNNETTATGNTSSNAAGKANKSKRKNAPVKCPIGLGPKAAYRSGEGEALEETALRGEQITLQQ
jgi:hypothetical protein